MQETSNENGDLVQEYFSAQSDEDVNRKMDKRLKHLQTKGHTLVRRVKIGRNDLCPCGSGNKFKRCCINKL